MQFLNISAQRETPTITTTPSSTPDVILQPKLKYLRGRKRALTGREVATLQEEGAARERHKA